MKFACEVFSCFPEESETLFFGGDTILRIKGIIKLTNGIWKHYDKYMEPMNAFSRMMNGLTVKGQHITTKKSNQKVMKVILRDVLRNMVGQSDVSETPKYIEKMVLFNHSASSSVHLLYDELMSQYEWLHCILKMNRVEMEQISSGIKARAEHTVLSIISDSMSADEGPLDMVTSQPLDYLGQDDDVCFSFTVIFRQNVQ